MSDQQAVDQDREAFYAARKAARDQRRAFAASADSAFVRVMKSCITQYLKARTEGVSREDGIKGIEAELRAVWPGQTTKFAPECGYCEDTGWREHVCSDALRCGRKRCALQHPAFEHPYVASCGCEKGQTHRKRLLTTDDAVSAVGRGKGRKKATWSRVGFGS